MWQYFGFLCLLEMCCVTSHLLFPWNFSFLPFHVFLACGRGPSVFCKDPSLSPASIKFRSDFFIDHWRMLHICTLPRVSSFHVFLTSFHSPMGLISVSCFSCCCCGVTAWGMHFHHLKLDGGCGEGFSASSSDAQPPVLVLCSLFLLYLLIDDDNDTTLRKESTSKFMYRNGKQIGQVFLILKFLCHA